MAKADFELKVSLERAIHDGIQQVLQQIWDDHKVCVREISVDWVDASSPADPKMILTRLDMRTSTHA